MGLSDARIGELSGEDEAKCAPPALRRACGPVYKAVDSCAAEVEAQAPTSTRPTSRRTSCAERERESVIILGAGPNRIGQGIEFDYCCVQAVQTFRGLGYDAVMINCNPETVSTDADTSDRLYFEPLTVEDVLEVVEREQPVGVVVMFGGQTPLRLARRLEEAGVPILGTPFEAIDIAEDRERFGGVLAELGLRAPAWGIARDAAHAGRDRRPDRLPGAGAPVLRPRRPRDADLLRPGVAGERPVQPGSLVDRFVEDAIEVDVDAICDGADASSARSCSTSRRPACTPATRPA